MNNVSNVVAVLIILACGIGALKAFTKGNKVDALWTALIGLFVASIVSSSSRSAWEAIISTVISALGKIINSFSGEL